MTDIVLVTVDSLCADHVGWRGFERPVAPHLNNLAADALSSINPNELDHIRDEVNTLRDRIKEIKECLAMLGCHEE